MKTESKTEVKGGLECPEVDRDSKADGTTALSTLVSDLDPSNDSPREPEGTGEVGNVSVEKFPPPVYESEHDSPLQTTEDAPGTEAVHPKTSEQENSNEQRTLIEEAASLRDSQNPEMCTDETALSVVVNTEKIPVIDESVAPTQTTEEVAGAKAVRCEISIEDISNDQQTPNELAHSLKDSQDPETRTEVSAIEQMPDMSESGALLQTTKAVACANALHIETSQEVMLNELLTIDEEAASSRDSQDPEMHTEESAQSVVNNPEKIPVSNESVVPPQSTEEAAGKKVICPEISIEDISNDQQTPNELAHSLKDPQDPETRTEVSAESVVDAIEQMPDMSEPGVLLQTTKAVACANALHIETSQEVILNEHLTIDEGAASSRDSQDPEMHTEESAQSVVDNTGKIPVSNESVVPPQSTEEAAGTKVICPEISIEDISNDLQTPYELVHSLKDPQDPETRTEVSAESVVDNTGKIPVSNESVVPPQSTEEAAGTKVICPEISIEDISNDLQTPYELVHSLQKAAGKKVICPEISIEDISNDQQTPNELAHSLKDPQDPETRTEVSAESVVDAIEQMPDMSEPGALLQSTKDVACVNAIHTETSQEVMLNEQQTLDEKAASSRDSQDPEMLTEESAQSVVDNTGKIPVSNESVVPPQSTEEAAEVIQPEISNEDISIDQQESNELAPSLNDPQDPETRTKVPAKSVVDTSNPIPVVSEYVSFQTKNEVDCAEAIHPKTSTEVILNKQQTPNAVAALPTDSQDPVMCTQESSDSEVDIIGQMLALSESEDDSVGPVDDVPVCVNYQNDTSLPGEESERVTTPQATNQLCTAGTVSLEELALSVGGGLTDGRHNTDTVDIDSSELKNSEDLNPCPPNKTGSILCTGSTTDNPTEELCSDDIESISKEHPGENQSGTGSLGINMKARRVRFSDQEPVPASGTSSEKADSAPEIAKLSVKELIKYYKWCNQGISSEEALAKAKQRGLMPQSDNAPHPNCKLKWGEIKNISRVINNEVQRTKYQVEVYFGGKDPEKELQLVLSKMNVDRHPDCQHSWKELEDFSNASQEYLRLNYKVETFYEGKNAPKVDLGDPPECGILSKENLQPGSTSDKRASQGSSGVKKEFGPEALEISSLNLNNLKKYYQWLLLGFPSDEALKRAKEPGLELPIKHHVFACKDPGSRQLTRRHRRDIARIIPGDYAKLRFDIDVLYGGMDPIEQLKLMTAMSKIHRHPNCKHPWEELEKMSNKLEDVYLRTKFLVQTFCNGKEPLKCMKEIQDHNHADEVAINMQQTEYLIANMEPNSVLAAKESCNQLKKYYKWRILGASSDEAIAKTKDRDLVPETEDSHPNCKLTMEEIIKISSLIPANLPRKKFKIEAFLGGKDPIKLLEIMLAVSKVERHPNCKHSWQELEEMSSKVTNVLERSKFLVHVYCNGKKPEELKETMGLNLDLSKIPVNSKTNVTAQAKSSASENPDNPNSETMEVAKLSLNQLKKYYKWRILGVTQSEAVVKAKEPGLIPQTEDSHPDCKLPWEEIKETALLIPAKHQRSKFQVEVFLGGKDPDEQLKLMMTESKAKRHLKCKHSWEELKQLCHKFPKESLKFKFVVNAFYGGKQPADLFKDVLSEANVSDEPQNPAAMNYSGAVSEKSADSVDTTFEEGPIKELPNWQLKNYYLWRNKGADHSTALAKVSEMPLGEHSRHSNCQSSESEVKQMSVPLSDTIQANRFYIHVYYGGKDPVNTLKYFQPCSAASDSFTDSIDTTIEEGPIKDLLNWQLKNYYLWRNCGKDHTFALANISQPVKVTGKHPPHPNCQNSESEVKKMAIPLSANTIMVSRFFLHVYYGGKDPASTLKYLLSCPNVSYAYNDPTESPVIEPDDFSSFSNSTLRFYYSWRNKGCNHTTALSNVRKKVPFSGEFLPHRHCKISKKEAQQMSYPLSHDPLKKERFFIHVYYGGKDPECTMKHFMPSPKSQPEDFLARHENQMLENCLELGLSRDEAMSKAMKRPNSAQPVPFQPVAKRTRGSLYGQIIPLDSPEHPMNILNCSELRKFHLIFHKEGARLEAMIRARNPGVTVPTPKKFISRCLVNISELESMSNRLPAKLRQFFVTETFFGGSDPEEVIEYLLRRASNKTSQPDTHSADDASKSSGCLDDMLLPLDSPKHPINILQSGPKLMKFYQWFYKGFSPEEAILKVKSGEAKIPPKSTTSRCLVPKPRLEAMSQSLPEHLRKRFMVETFYGGSDPNEVMEYFLRKGNSVRHQFHTEGDEEFVPLGSVKHPINMLNSHELMKYHLWVIDGSTRSDAMFKVKNTLDDISPPRNFVSRCFVPLQELETMSNRLPLKFKNLFIVETFYGGSDPAEVMAYLLRKASAEHREPGIVPLDSPEHPINTLNFTELNTYYHWILKGCSREHAIAKVKSPHLYFPVSTNFVSKCRVSKKGLKVMSTGLPTQLRSVFISECLYGGSDPREVFEYLLAKAKRTESKRWPVEPQTNPVHNAGVPVYPPQEPYVGMSSHSNYADWNAAGSSSMHPQPPTTHPQHQGYFQQDPANYGHFGSSAVTPFQFAHPNPGFNPQPTQNFHPGYPPPGQPHEGHPPLGHPTSGHPPLSYGYPPEIPVPQPCQPPASGSHRSDLPQVAATIPPVVYPPDQFPFISQPPIIYPHPHPIPTPAVPHQPGPSVTPVTPNVMESSPQVHPSAVTTLGIKFAPPQVTAKSNTYGEYESVNKELSKAILPIKINLKSTSHDLNKSQKQSPQSPQKPKTTKILDKTKPAQGDGSVPVHIVPTGYPHERLNEEHMDAIESNLLEAILEMDDEGLKPSFKDSSRSDGRYNITCIDEFSVNWLCKYLVTYQPWPGASLKLISGGPKKIRANAVLPPCKADDDQKILKFIERQNKGLNVNLWTVVQRWNNGDFNTCIELVIDEESAEVLQKCSRINFKLGSAEIVIAKEDDQVLPDVEMCAVAESSKTTAPISARNYRRASPPPPPKRVLSGESIPTPPPKRSCNQEKSRSSQNSEERGNSACRAPSRDRFGQSTSKSPSPAEQNPWMVGFFSNVSQDSTHEIKRGRNYRRSGSRLSEDRGSDSATASHSSSKYRKRHVSRSPSQEYRSMSRSPTPNSSRSKKRYRHERSYSKSPSPKNRRPSPGPSSQYYEY